MTWFKQKTSKSGSNNVHSGRKAKSVQFGDDPVRPYTEDRDICAYHLFLYTSLVLIGLITIPMSLVQSAPSVFLQSSWDIENPTSFATAPFVSWNEYGSKDLGVVTGPDIRLQPVNYTLIQESDDGLSDSCPATGCSTGGGFNAGVLTNTEIHDTGISAHIKLATTASDGSYVTNFGPGGFIKSNAGTGNHFEEALDIAIDGTHVYVAGYDSWLSDDERWRVEKRDIITGAFDNPFDGDGRYVPNPNLGDHEERITAIVVDDNFVYIAGFASVTGNELWRIEKLNKGSASPAAGFGVGGIIENDPSVGDDRINAMAIDSTHIYVAGFDSTPGDTQWRIEKRDIVSGALDSGFNSTGIIVSNQNSGSETVHDIAVDDTHIYLAGYDSSQGNPQWRIEKRNKVTGALESAFDGDGVVESNPSAGPDVSYVLAINASHLFIAGYDSFETDAQWRIEKRDLTSGALDNTFDSDGIVVNNPSSGADYIHGIAIDQDYIYLGGYDDTPGNLQWRMENRDISTGNPITIFGSGGSIVNNQNVNSEMINAVAIDGRYLYAVGYEFTQGSPKWRIEKRFAREYKPSGTFESPVLDLGAAQDITKTLWFPPNPQPQTTVQIHVQAGISAAPDCPGTCANWTDWISVTHDTDTGTTFDNNRYAKYRVTFTTSNPKISSWFNRFNLEFTNFPIGAGLVSSVFDTGNKNNFLKNVSWTATGSAPMEVRLQIATSGDNVNWVYCGTGAGACSTSDWLDFTASPNNYYTSGDLTNLESSDAVNDRFFKYKVWLAGDGTNTPSADDITITYDTMSLSVYNPSGSSHNFSATAGTPFKIVVKSEDSGGTPLPDHDGSMTVKLIASLPQPDKGLCVSSFTDNGNTEFSTTGTYVGGVMDIDDVVLCDASTPSFTIGAIETSGGGLSSTTDLNVSAVDLDSPLELAFAVQPPPTFLVSADITPMPVIHIQDQFGNIDTTESTLITLSPFLDSACSLAASGVFNATSGGTSNGIATFSNVNYSTIETIYLQAAGGSFASACSSALSLTDAGFTVQIDPIVDVINDDLIITSSLLNSGSLITDNANMSLTRLEILDEQGTSISGNLNGSGTTVTDLVNSIYHTSWNPSGGLVPALAYTIVSEITYDGVLYQGSKVFFVNLSGIITADLQNLGNKLDNVQTTVTSIDTKAADVETGVAGLDTKITNQEAVAIAHRAEVINKLSTLKTNVGKILEDTSNAIPNLLKNTIAKELAKGAHSEIVTTQATIKTGATLPFRFRTASGLSPTVTVFDPNENARIAAVTMKEVGGTGIYLNNITFNKSWGLGNFMIRVNESTKQTVDHIVLTVVEAKQDPLTKSTVGTSAVTIDTLFSRMNNISNTVTSLSTSVDTVKSNTDSVGTDIDELLKKMVKDGSVSGTPASSEDSAKLSQYLTSVSSIIGSSGGTSDYRTILGKLNGIESTLKGLGTDAETAASFNDNARQKAERIKSFVMMVMQELKDEGKVEDPQEKVEIIEGYLTDLKTTVEEIPSSVTTDGIADSVAYTLEELDEVTSQNEGLSELMPLVEPEYEEVLEVKTAEDLTPTDLQDMRNDVTGLKSLMLEVRGLLDQEVNAPVVHGWLEGE